MKLLNTVTPRTTCIRCDRKGCTVYVYEDRIETACGHVRNMPPIHRNGTDRDNCRGCHG